MTMRRPGDRPTKGSAIGVVVLGLALMLSGCGERDIGLRLVRNADEGPEEFGIVPNKELSIPENLANLPAPTPGGRNAADQRPVEDAVAALGGNPSRLRTQGGTPRGDGALITQASRFGRDSGIRQQLAAEDLEFRKRKSLFSFKVVKTDEYVEAYRRLRLDPYPELSRFRRAGVRTPSAPPKGYEF